MNKTELWNQFNAQLDYAFLIILLIAVGVVILRWIVGPSRRLAFDRFSLGIAGGMMMVALGAIWFS